MAEQPRSMVEVPIGQFGLDLKTDPRKLPLGKLIQADNVAITKDGKFGKRYGTSRTTATDTSGASISSLSPWVLGTRGDELVAVSRGKLHSLSTNRTKWAYRDQVPEWTCRRQNIIKLPGIAQNADVAINTTLGLVGYVWTDNTSGGAARIVCAITDESTGTVLMGPTSMGSSVDSPRILAVGNYFIVTVMTGALIKASAIDLTSFPYTAPAFTNIVIDSAGSFYDATVFGSRFVVFYSQTATGTGILKEFNTSLTNTTSGSTEVMSGPVSIYGYGSVLYGTHRVGNDVRVIVADSSLTVTSGPTTAYTFSGAYDSAGITVGPTGNIFVLADRQSEQLVASAVLSSTATLTGSRTLLHATLISKPFTSQLKSWAVVTLYNGVANNQPTAFLVDFFADVPSTSGHIPRPVCSVSPRASTYTSSTPTRTYGALANIVTDSNGKFITAASVDLKALNSRGVTRIIFDSDQSERQTCELGGLMYLTGGVPSWYDGFRVGEVGFIHYPTVSVADSATAGSLVAGQTYLYAVVYANYDAHGNIHRSAPVKTSITLGGGKSSADVTIDYLTHTTRQDLEHTEFKCWFEIYRSAQGGSVLRLVNSVEPTASQTNTQTSLTATFNDGVSDATISTRPFLYTTGGVLDNVCPPSSTLCAVWNSRLVLAGCEDRKEWWMSKPYVNGEAPGFNEALSNRIEEGGDITALGVLDDKLVFFKDSMTFVYYGDGPDDRGVGSTLQGPVRLSTDIGCIDPNSVVYMPFGLMFRSRIGIYLLTRALEFEYIGQDVEDELTSTFTIVSAKLVPDQSQVRFLLSAPSVPSSKELRFDYRAKVWTLIKYWAGSSGAETYGGLLRSATVHGAVYKTIDNSGNIWAENTAQYTDVSSFVPRIIEFGDFSSQGTDGYQSVSHIVMQLDTHTDHNINVAVTIDNAYTEYANLNSTVASPVNRKDIHLKRQKNGSVRVKLTESAGPNVNSGQGFSLVSMSFEVAGKQGRYRDIATTGKG